MLVLGSARALTRRALPPRAARSGQRRALPPCTCNPLKRSTNGAPASRATAAAAATYAAAPLLVRAPPDHLGLDSSTGGGPMKTRRWMPWARRPSAMALRLAEYSLRGTERKPLHVVGDKVGCK